jgi:hypothetical protein
MEKVEGYLGSRHMRDRVEASDLKNISPCARVPESKGHTIKVFALGQIAIVLAGEESIAVTPNKSFNVTRDTISR